MKNLHINNSYNIWDTSKMRSLINEKCLEVYSSDSPETILHRTYWSMFVEWWLHNIGYYATKPFCNIEFFKMINLKCKDVDINEWKE